MGDVMDKNKALDLIDSLLWVGVKDRRECDQEEGMDGSTFLRQLKLEYGMMRNTMVGMTEVVMGGTNRQT